VQWVASALDLYKAILLDRCTLSKFITHNLPIRHASMLAVELMHGEPRKRGSTLPYTNFQDMGSHLLVLKHNERSLRATIPTAEIVFKGLYYTQIVVGAVAIGCKERTFSTPILFIDFYSRRIRYHRNTSSVY
jgi:hypothetical protein